MSVYIPGMEMPKSCDECRFDNDVYCLAYPQSADMIYDIADGIPQFCPLIAVPDHGDLIDRDMVLKKAWDVETFVDAVKYAPTIISADKEGADNV